LNANIRRIFICRYPVSRCEWRIDSMQILDIHDPERLSCAQWRIRAFKGAEFSE
jgi:hypothetical protein